MNRLVSANKIDEDTGALRQVVSYRYNYKNLRIERTDDEGTTRYVFDLAGNIIEEHDAERLTRYVFRNNKHLAKITPDGKTYYYGTDNLGSTTVLFDEDGNVVWKGEISAFGDVVLGEWIGEELFDERVRFTGKDYDEVTGLYYFNARWYDPQLGRFTSEDPVRDGMNWYVYVSNNPLKFVDPTGLEEAYFLYTYKDTEYDQKLKSYERNSINDDVQRLEDSGSTVAVSESTNKSDVISAFQDNEAELIVISGHGYDGDTGVQTSDRQAFSPKDLADVGIGENLKAVIFENCYQGDIKDQWQAVLGDDVEIVAWEDTMTTGETRRFNSHGMFDRQENRLSDYVGAVIDE